MKDTDLIFGLFFSDDRNRVYEKIKFPEKLSEEKREHLRVLSLRFLGPLFLTAALSDGGSWVIELIESTLSKHQERTLDVDVLQSFFALNSTIKFQGNLTNLFTLIGSPYTEDIKMIYDKIHEYIHPSINQGTVVNKNFLGTKFNFDKFIQKEISRGFNLIESTLGSPRKMYWEEEQKYYCVGLIDREISEDSKKSSLLIYDVEDPLRKLATSLIPSYYIMSILPDYYENRISETLKLFDKTSNFPNIKMIKLRHQDKYVIYFEEFHVEGGIKKSYGVVLVPENDKISHPNIEFKRILYFKKTLRYILDNDNKLEENLIKINPAFNPFVRWDAISEEGLYKIHEKLDNPE